MPVKCEGGRGFEGLVNREGLCVWEGALPGSATCHVLGGSRDETSTADEEDTQGHSVHLMPAGRITSLCKVEPIRGLVMRLLVIPRHIMGSFKDLGCRLTNHSYSASLSARQAPCFPTFPIRYPALAILLLVSRSSRGQAGERRGVLYYSTSSRVF